LDSWLRDWDLRDCFDLVYCSGDEGRVKPDPSVYRETLARLDLGPDEALFIDDTVGHVAAARALGLHGIVFCHARQLASDLAALLGDERLAAHSPSPDCTSPTSSKPKERQSP
jgi:putative hydrolase of the HAD superfamily